MAETKRWTTLEELLLACAVKRHGFADWDSVAMELQSRSSLPLLLTAQVCKNKYHDLKRRFMDPTERQQDEADTVPWLEDLRKLRVAELKREVHRYDLSIQSLQLKVKRLEEEREGSLKENENDDGEPDLEKNSEEERSENDKQDGSRTPGEALPGNAAGESSDYRSCKESNSTENRAARGEQRRGPETVEGRDVKRDPVSGESKPAGEDSCNDSSDTVAKHAAAAAKSIQEKKGGDSAGLRNSASESKERTASSDVQSSASLTRKRRRQLEVSGGSSGGDDELVVSPATIKREAVKSEPLVGLLDIIRSHKHGSVFQRRLDSQKTDGYKNMVRQHIDLETIQTRVNNGSYSSNDTSKFHRDLLLLFTNAAVFFPKKSPESLASYELRNLVLEETKKKRKTLSQRSDSSPEPAVLQPKPDPGRSESLLAKHKSSAPIVVCRKRSSISAKASNTALKAAEKITEQQQPVKEPAIENEEKEKPVTGTRSMRRSSKGRPNNNPPNKNADENSADKGGGGGEPADKKKMEAVAVKRRGAADFLKRIKKNSSIKGTPLLDTLKSRGGSDAGKSNTESREQKKRGKEAPSPKPRGGGSGGRGGKRVKAEESSPSKRGVGRPPKKGVEASGKKRGREGGGAEAASKQAKKRPRR